MTASILVARFVPFVLICTAGFSSYVLVGLLSVDYLLTKKNATGTAVSILVPYFFLVLLTTASFFRLIYITYFDPPFVPLGKGYNEATDKISVGEYFSGREELASPELEMFFNKDVFVVDHTGRPWWCSTCRNWKPDRAHHCSRSGRCIRKMDHFCPWVGGPIGESNFKFFIQFTSYGALYCTFILTVLSVYVSKLQKNEGHNVNLLFLITIGLASVFLLFAGGMSLGSIRLAIKNLTQVEMRGAKKRVHTLAIHISSQEKIDRLNESAQSCYNPYYITYPLQNCNDPLTCTADTVIFSSSERNPNLFEIPDKNIPNHTLNSYAFNSQPITNQSDRQDRHLKYNNSYISEPQNLSVDYPENREDGSNLSPVNNISSAEDSDLQEKLDQVIGSPTISHSQETLANPITHRPTYRTFAITRTNEGENPWDLGTWLANWKTVMGEKVIDWFLPIRRSPCCIHDNPESLYQVGMAVNNIRLRHGFLDPDIMNKEV